MKKNVFGITLFILVVLCFSGVASAETLIGRVNDWAPLYYQENGKWIGICVDAFETLSKESGINYELKVLPWTRAMKDMENEPIMMGYLTPTDERKKIMHFIGPHHVETMSLAIGKKYKNEKIDSLDDLVRLIKKTGKKVAYQQDVHYSDEFNRRIKNDQNFASHFHKMVSYENAPLMIIGDRVLGFFDSMDAIIYSLKTKYKNDPIELHSFVVSETKVYIGVSKTISPATLTKLQEANKRLLANGSWDRLIKKWSKGK